MRALIVFLLAMTLWSINSIGAIEADVTMKISPQRIQVNVGEYKVQPGEKVSLFRKTCVGPKVSLCSNEYIGQGEVSRVLNDKYSEIILPPNADIKEGDTIVVH